jgi:hypothetical protein
MPAAYRDPVQSSSRQMAAYVTFSTKVHPARANGLNRPCRSEAHPAAHTHTHTDTAVEVPRFASLEHYVASALDLIKRRLMPSTHLREAQRPHSCLRSPTSGSAAHPARPNASPE